MHCRHAIYICETDTLLRGKMKKKPQLKTNKLPKPLLQGDFSLEAALLMRRSVSSFQKALISLDELGQLLWAAQGVTNPDNFRTAPSAGALYPINVYAAVGNVKGLDPGVYKYRPGTHDIVETGNVDKREALCRAALVQKTIRQAPVVIVLAANFEKTTVKYGRRGFRYVLLETGHMAQNICLQAVALHLGSAVIGAFSDAKVSRILGLDRGYTPLYLLPQGKPEETSK